MARVRRRWGSGIDTAWLQLEREDNSVVVHGVLWCEGPVDVAALRERVRERWLPHYPGLRQRPVWAPGHLGPVRWQEHSVDLEAHVREGTLSGGDGADDGRADDEDTALATAIGAALSTSLPTDRPWWRLTVYTGARSGRSAIHVALHHGLGDGVAMNHLFHVLGDADLGEDTPVAYRAAPVALRGPGDVRVFGRGVRERRGVLGAQIRDAMGGRRGELVRTARAVLRGTVLLVRPHRDARTLLQGSIGPDKAVRWTPPLELSTVKAAGKRDGGSVNDVLCAAVAGALRTFLAEAEAEAEPGAGAGTAGGAGAGAGGGAGTGGGGPVPRLRAVVPTNLRPMDRPVSVRLGNEVGLALPSLPTDESDPVRRVQRMHRTMAAVKRTDQALVTFAGIAVGGLFSPRRTRGLVRRYAGTSSVVISNVPGPVTELSVAGAPVSGMLFWVPCTWRLALGVSILSYAGRLRLGVAGDTRVLDRAGGIDRFTALLDAELDRVR